MKKFLHIIILFAVFYSLYKCYDNETKKEIVNVSNNSVKTLEIIKTNEGNKILLKEHAKV